MESGQAAVHSGHLVRGYIMNAMTPVVDKNGQVQGYIWANELMDYIDQQITSMRWSVFGFTCLALVCSLALIYWVISHFIQDIESIKRGLTRMGSDLNAHIPAMHGETGDMAVAVNYMAQSLANAQQRERLASVRALEQSEETLRVAIDATDEAFVLFDNQNRLMFCNERYKALYPKLREILVEGTPYENILRRAVEQEALMVPMTDTEFATRVQKRLELYCAGDATVEEKTPDGRWLRVVNRRTTTGYTVGFRVDITDLKNAKDAAEDANRVKGQFLATMSHELRTPMNGILGTMDLLLTTTLNSEQHDYVETAKESADLLLGLLNDILDFSNMEAGRFVVEQQPLILRQLIHDIESEISDLAIHKGLAFNLRIGESVPDEFIGDRIRLRQVFMILLRNAVKFTQFGRVVFEIETFESFGEIAGLKFSVMDTGIGISESQLSLLFRPFSQADGSITRRFGGAGLGLSIAQRLVALMKGEIGVESVEGKGTTFWVTQSFTKPKSLA